MDIGKSTEASITFNHSNGFYYAGEQVSGVISFHNNHKKIALNKAAVGFIGEFGYVTQETCAIPDCMGTVLAENCTVYHRLQFIDIHLPLKHSKGNETKVILHQGQLSWPFEFILPQYLPPSSSGPLTGSYPYVKYYIHLVLDETRNRLSKQHIFPLTIFPHVNIFNINEEKKSISVSRRNQKHFQLTANLQQRAVLPGQSISLDVNLENPKRLAVKRIEATLIQHREIAKNAHCEIIFQMDLPIRQDLNETEFHQTFCLRVPHGHLLPTHHSMAPCSTLSISTKIHYELKLVAKIRGILDDIILSIPIIIGTKSSSELNQLEENSYIELPINYLAPMKQTDIPPTTYWSNMCKSIACAENLFIAVMNLLVEVLETTEVTRGLYEKELIDKTIEFNVPHVIHADMKRDEEVHRQHSEGIH
ncbi:unnamed protein product [Rotaria socialis]|uniref:Arrestin C-terminal-like domain-containing protein n=1 Tax=Rotaria socialis TaxID=392032 RepID=A0A818ZSH1_9BILA|nr:unnamed protein product [Rotaria socialis]CAF4471172.1 unnamed protein product [Rotaria socialis]